MGNPCTYYDFRYILAIFEPPDLSDTFSTHCVFFEPLLNCSGGVLLSVRRSQIQMHTIVYTQNAAYRETTFRS